ncbi:SH3 domain-binding protein 5-like [Hydractinia symbiolongicarpus]|uniref:SH3 domain-binding protein 5-like n=1 Tax=Hydractinia symbiolongicarpus TaxID=13093 RepID=UPI00254B84C0|nr:SH3 domain-binding protein 5-like [Hydractinia symbiolongicarpus]
MVDSKNDNVLEESSSETDSEDSDEELDPRIQMELEKLNAATDGINHLETEFGEAQALFNQMMQDATFQLKAMHQQLGKSVDKSRPYYEALIQAKYKKSQLHQAALKFEQAQSRHYNAKKRVKEAEKRAFSTNSRRIDPAFQEILNQATIEVMEAADESQKARENHKEASLDVEDKQKIVQDLYNSLKKNITKSRPYFDLKMALNIQLEVQKQRLEKIQEGLQGSKNVYSDTLHNLEVISDDIHKARRLKRQSLLLPRGEGVGAESDFPSMPHNATMERIRKTNLDDDTFSNFDAQSTDSEISNDNLLLTSDFARENYSPNSPKIDIVLSSNGKESSVSSSNDSPCSSRSYSASDKDYFNSVEDEDLRISHLTLDIDKDIKEISSKVDASYEVITSHSIPHSPPPFDILDGPKNVLQPDVKNGRRSRSFTDLSRFEYLMNENSDCLKRCNSDGSTRKRQFGSFSFVSPQRR